ncbi:hypothetical protein [Mycoplasma yeatsii]|uniref:Lipoprotein n=1 Tax=Mycoplasma yeatsii TaxID=51365 RepID=A0ABU0NEP6_9MOLU|nr:hypothetical protein [Mycoplasma yeatsii]MDQ0567893.1 hypothetical protein [Mycoplasma yeatsii]
MRFWRKLILFFSLSSMMKVSFTVVSCACPTNSTTNSMKEEIHLFQQQLIKKEIEILRKTRNLSSSENKLQYSLENVSFFRQKLETELLDNEHLVVKLLEITNINDWKNSNFKQKIIWIHQAMLLTNQIDKQWESSVNDILNSLN